LKERKHMTIKAEGEQRMRGRKRMTIKAKGRAENEREKAYEYIRVEGESRE
jgi:hypothetical protein